MHLIGLFLRGGFTRHLNQLQTVGKKCVFIIETLNNQSLKTSNLKTVELKQCELYHSSTTLCAHANLQW